MSKAKSISHPHYQIRVSSRAKHVSIKVSHLGEVEVVVPQGFDQRKLPEILKKRQDWIAKTIERIRTERLSMRDDLGTLPDKILLRSLPEEWRVFYRPTNEAHVKLIVKPTAAITLQGRVEHTEPCYTVLRRWLTRKAHQHLVPWLRQVSAEVDLPFSRASVRGQKTLWASCSSKQSISLNFKLLFLPPHLVRYVFIHELCHTVHLNHSPKFWQLVEQNEPDYKDLDRELNKAWRYVPEWVERSLESE